MQIAEAATCLAQVTVKYTRLDMGVMMDMPDLIELDKCIAKFEDVVVAAARSTRLEPRGIPTRDACLDLIRAVAQLRMQVANNHDYHGEEMTERRASVLAYAAACQVHATNVALLAPHGLGPPAERLAAAASHLGETATRDTDLMMRASLPAPDFNELDECAERFRQAARTHARASRREQLTESNREACVDLLRAATDLRAQVANNHEYHGEEMAARLAQTRKIAAAVKVAATKVELIAPEAVTDSAEQLALAASRLAAFSEVATDLGMSCTIQAPDFTEFDECTAAFINVAADVARTDN
jgi:hypothetical protein